MIPISKRYNSYDFSLRSLPVMGGGRFCARMRANTCDMKREASFWKCPSIQRYGKSNLIRWLS